MTREQFWAVVAQSSRDAESVQAPRRGLLRRRPVLRPGQRHVLALEQLLTQVPDAELVSFQEHLDAVRGDLLRWDLRGAAAVALRGVDEDVFTDLRTWLVSQGRAACERVLGDPDALVDVVPPDLPERVADAEAWGYVALEVWDARHDDDMPRPGFRQDSAPAGEPLPQDDAALRRRYPRLAARFP